MLKEVAMGFSFLTAAKPSWYGGAISSGKLERQLDNILTIFPLSSEFGYISSLQTLFTINRKKFYLWSTVSEHSL